MKPEKEAFLQVLDEHKLIIYKIANTYCHDREDQKDLVQEIIIQLWQSFPKYNSQFKFSTWMYRITLNVAISHLRKSTTKQNNQPLVSLDFVEIQEDSDNGLNEDVKLLKQFIEEMNGLNKALMILYLDGKTHEEIATVLNISKSNVGTKINRIKKQLKQKFQTIAS